MVAEPRFEQNGYYYGIMNHFVPGPNRKLQLWMAWRITQKSSEISRSQPSLRPQYPASVWNIWSPESHWEYLEICEAMEVLMGKPWATADFPAISSDGHDDTIWAMVNTHYMVDGHPIHNKDPYNGYYKSLWTIGWLAPINGY